ncbi:unnamed protein product [Callosobruchus maculatus]|uniref:Uncharacterized protein n=1 Tax=Callosobruchus maculatus TaxID=64391 RepID=A0A653D715_CALMS|nr:unnamed protein product [Callosobruchus maculatus]
MKNHSNASSYQPEFAEPIVNLSVPLGRDATFTCLVHHLGGYRQRPRQPVAVRVGLMGKETPWT